MQDGSQSGIYWRCCGAHFHQINSVPVVVGSEMTATHGIPDFVGSGPAASEPVGCCQTLSGLSPSNGEGMKEARRSKAYVADQANVGRY